MVRREFPDHPLIGVGGIVIDGDRVLLVRRARAPLKGKWSLPGGLVERGETLKAAVRREVAEETGLRVRVGKVVEVLDYIVRDGKRRPLSGGSPASKKSSGSRDSDVRFHYVLVDFLCRNQGREPKAATDVSEIQWATRNHLGRFGLRAATRRVIEKAFELMEHD